MDAVLVTNGQLRKTLASVRSLGSKGVPVYVAETTRFNMSAYSRYCAGSCVSPDPVRDGRAYAEWLSDRMERLRIPILFPMDDSPMDAAIEHADLFREPLRRIVPPPASYAAASDKGEAVRLAVKAGVHVPQTFFPESPEEAERLSGKLGDKAVIKPRRSSGSRGIRIVGGRQNVREQFAEVHQKYPFPLLQQYIPAGERYDVCLLYDAAGELRAHFVQKELRHFPLEIGPSTVQESVHRPDLLELALSIMNHLPWRGIVELEFMIDPRDGQPVLMEINPRFWNSLYASILSGVDFPWLLYQIAGGNAVAPITDYKGGIRCRSLLPGDLLHYMANPKRRTVEPAFWARSGTSGSDDILSLHDPMPTVGFMLACLRSLPDPKAWNMVFKRS
ncbi:ATP-grasp domain-containing protein [Paenibacillus thermotolerans]|uniref:carboxylate--amine ligase n=1 Tax=Paenibacillus thermotolerans TaxID=3027807 RepID=UPI002367BB11|nr:MULTISPECIES: ATP-grasp domain-containing protein [unclassified Paenibacillus]